jgi:hypothetical protein
MTGAAGPSESGEPSATDDDRPTTTAENLGW